MELHFVVSEAEPGRWLSTDVKVQHESGQLVSIAGIPGHAHVIDLCSVLALLKLRFQHGLEAVSRGDAGEDELKLHRAFRAQYRPKKPNFMDDIFKPFGGKEQVVLQQGQPETGKIRFADGFSPDRIKVLNAKGESVDLAKFVKTVCGISVTSPMEFPSSASSGAELVRLQAQSVANRTYPVEQTIGAIQEALKRDFSSSTIDLQSKANLDALRILESLGLNRAGLSPDSDAEPVHELPSKGQLPPDSRFTLTKFPEITVQCLSNAPSCVATFMTMKTGELQMPINLLYYQPHGFDLAMSLAERAFDYEFLCSAQQGLHFFGGIDVSEYHHVLSVQSMEQHLYTNGKKLGYPKRVYYHRGTSSDEAARLLKLRLQGTAKIELVPRNTARIIETGLDDGEGAILWGAIVVPKHWIIVPRVDLTEVRFCLYAHKSWMSKNKRRDILAFRNAFVATWKRLQHSQEEAFRLLKHDSVYQKYFAMNCELGSTDQK